MMFDRGGFCACRMYEYAVYLKKEPGPCLHDAKKKVRLSRLVPTNTFTATFSRLDVLVNNAGILMFPAGTTKDGFELQFG